MASSRTIVRIFSKVLLVITYLAIFPIKNKLHVNFKSAKTGTDINIPIKEYKNIDVKHKLAITPQSMSSEDEVAKIVKLYPNLPIAYWMKIRKKAWSMYASPDCAPFPEMYKLNIDNVYWQVIHMTNQTTVQVYSAYYDIRSLDANVVRILSLVNKSSENFPGSLTLYCQMWFENEDSPTMTPVDTVYYIWEKEWRSHTDGIFGPYLLGCSMPESHKDVIPQIVSLVENQCDKANNMLRVNYEEVKSKEEFSVCVKGLDFLQIDFSLRLIEWIEFLFLMGVSKIFFYQLEVHPNIKKVLDYYEGIGKIDVRLTKLSSGNPSIPFLQHEYLLENNLIQWLDELIPYNDCFYRNLYSYEYVALLDIDEVIVPLNESNWHDMIEKVKFKIPEVSFNGFTADNMYFFDDMDKETPYEGIPSFMHMSQHVYRSQNFTPFGEYVKTIFNTNETITCHNHYPIAVEEGSVTYNFAHEEARLQHYRNNCPPEIDCEIYSKDPVKDERMWDFKDVLVSNVLNAINNIGLFPTK